MGKESIWNVFLLSSFPYGNLTVELTYREDFMNQFMEIFNKKPEPANCPKIVRSLSVSRTRDDYKTISSDATAIWVNIPLETSFSIPLETEKTSDSATLIFLPLFITFDRQIIRAPVAGLK